MDPEVQAFIDKMAEKAEAKAASLAAVGAAKLAEAEGRDAASHWQTVAEEGFREGREGRLHAELQAMADAYVAAHPEFFVAFRSMDPDGLAIMVNSMRDLGMLEEATKLTMFERASFERQDIGSRIKARLIPALTGG